MIHYFMILGIGYLVGAIPIGWIIARCVGIPDITHCGSGNIGATNVARIAGIKYFFVVLVLDVIKAFLYMRWVQVVSDDQQLLCMAAVVLLIGNGFSCFLQGKGGKGVATTLGIVWSFNPLLIYYLFFVWIVALSVTRKMGIASVISFLALPWIAYCIMPLHTDFVILLLFICLWGLWRHEKNIRQFFSCQLSA